jgi:serine/threonine-protein kinase RsbW
MGRRFKVTFHDLAWMFPSPRHLVRFPTISEFRSGSHVMVKPLCLDASHQTVVRQLSELPMLVDQILMELEKMGYTRKERLGVRLALEEALVNAIKHGNRGDADKTVSVRHQASDAQFTVEIEDEGNGFQLDGVPDPVDPENLSRPSGRGVLLMKHYMTWVQYNDIGNCVAMGLIRR